MTRKTLVWICVYTLIFAGSWAREASAVCPACIAGAGLGIFDAYAGKDLYRMGLWLAGFAYLTLRYIQVRLTQSRYGTVKLIIPALLLPFPLLFFISGIAIAAGYTDVPPLGVPSAFVLFTAGSAAGTFASFLGTVGSCVIKNIYGINIPFFRMTVILTLLWLVSLI